MLEVEDQIAEYFGYLDTLDPGVPVPLTSSTRTGRRRVTVLVAVCACLLLVAAVWLLRQASSPSPRISPADTSTSQPPAPPTFDVKAFFDQPRIPVGDHTGKVRGTIPTAAYKAAMGITADGSPPPQTPDNTPVPVVTDVGLVDGYWIPCSGFVERSVVERRTFDVESYCQEQKAQDARDFARWWAGLTPEQRQEAEQRGIQPPLSSEGTAP